MGVEENIGAFVESIIEDGLDSRERDACRSQLNSQIAAMVMMLGIAIDSGFFTVMAQAHYKIFNELQEAGFTEDQAMDILLSRQDMLSMSLGD